MTPKSAKTETFGAPRWCHFALSLCFQTPCFWTTLPWFELILLCQWHPEAEKDLRESTKTSKAIQAGSFFPDGGPSYKLDFLHVLIFTLMSIRFESMLHKQRHCAKIIFTPTCVDTLPTFTKTCASPLKRCNGVNALSQLSGVCLFGTGRSFLIVLISKCADTWSKTL